MVEFILPIFAAFGIGVYCKRKAMLSSEMVEGIKKLVTTFFLPLMSFRMFSQVKLEKTTLLLMGLSFGLYLLALIFGFATRRALGNYGDYSPFLLSSAEGGMLGIGLYQMAYGADNLAYLAPFDLGCGLFFFLVFLPILTGGKRAQGESTNQSVLEKMQRAVKQMLSVPVFGGCLAGLVFQIAGLATLFDSLRLTSLLLNCISVFTILIMPLMLIAIGFEFSIKRETLFPALKTTLLRVCIMAICFGLGAGALRMAGISEPLYFYALALQLSLPAAFLVALFVEEKAGGYVNTQLSIHVLITLALVTALKVYSV